MVPRTDRRNARTGLVLAGIAAAMAGLAFAAVPLYDAFRQAMGFGTSAQDVTLPQVVLDRTMAVRFNADLDPKLPWAFQPTRRQVSLRIGETGEATYMARNLGGAAMTGTATFTVTPVKAAKYFSQVRCFCFAAQRLAAGQEAELAVTFFVDPAIANDRNMDEVKTITLSYTFFRAKDDGESDRTTGPWPPLAPQQLAAVPRDGSAGDL